MVKVQFDVELSCLTLGTGDTREGTKSQGTRVHLSDKARIDVRFRRTWKASVPNLDQVEKLTIFA